MYDPNYFTLNIEQMLSGEPLDSAIGVLQVTVHSARGLKGSKIGGGTPDPFVSVSLNQRSELARTKYKHNTYVFVLTEKAAVNGVVTVSTRHGWRPNSFWSTHLPRRSFSLCTTTTTTGRTPRWVSRASTWRNSEKTRRRKELKAQFFVMAKKRVSYDMMSASSRC